MANAGTPASRLSRTTKEPRRFAEEEEYTTERAPSALRRAAERPPDQADDDDSTQSGVMTGTEFVAREKKAAEAAGISSKRADAPIYDPDRRAKLVKLPNGWKPSSKKEVETYFNNLTYAERNEVTKLHYYAFFSGGTKGFGQMGLDATIKFFRAYGLVVGPWHKHDFPGMCNSEALAKQRYQKAAQESNVQSSNDATFDRLGDLGLPKEDLSHAAQYESFVRDDLLTEAFLRCEPMPKGEDAITKKVKEWLPLEVDICVDCGRRRQLVRVEHAKGGEHDGERRKPPCPEDNKGERAGFDAYADALYLIGEEATPEGYQGVLDVRLAYAGRPGASAEDKMLLAMGRRAAAEATVLEDREALSYGSSLRGRRVCNDLGPTLEDARAKFQKKEDARVAALQERYAAARARLAALPAVRCGTRVVVVDPDDGSDPRPAVQATMGARGVVRTRGTGWFNVELDGASGTTTGYRRAELAIDKSRKPAARKPAARKPAAKPAARKPAAAKKRKAAEPARKPASKKKKSRK